MSQVKLAAARELIEEKKFIEARALLLTIKDDPTAAKWLAKLEARIGSQPGALATQRTNPRVPAPPPRNYTVIPTAPDRQYLPLEPAPVESIGLAGVFRAVWGILLLLSLGWICYGVTSTAGIVGNQLNTSEARNSEGFQAGTVIGGGLGLTFFLCTGVPLLLLFGILYWRNGVAIRETKKHNQTIQAMRRQ